MGSEILFHGILFHADDYGVTLAQSERILSCFKDGVLNSISILPNTLELGASLKLLNEVDTKNEIRRVLHINFVEGHPVSNIKDVPLLVDKDGYFDKSFIWFFKQNLTWGKKKRELAAQIKTEIAAQLRAVTKENDFNITAIDSHQHYHMIPIIFDSLMEVLSYKEFEDLNIQQVRIPVDPIEPVMHMKKLPGRIPAINIVKWSILRLYAERNKKILRQKGIISPVFFGIFYTCEMKWEVVSALLPAYKSYADKKGTPLELMFHPGNLTDKSELLDAKRKELEEFFMSDNRRYEADCLKMLKNFMTKKS